MERRHFLKSLGWLSAFTAIPAGGALAGGNDKVSGAAAVRGRVSSGGKGLANAVVSDGYNVVLTDKNGNYSLNAPPKAEFVFISLPSGYAIPNDKGIARFYQKIGTGPQQINFELERLSQDDNRHAFIIWADPQIRDNDDARQLKTLSAPDTKALADSLGNVPIHGIGCGDLVFDHPELFPDYREAIHTTGVPFFQVIGNHDMDYTARTDDFSQATFKEQFGPAYYSFNRGKIHYVVLDDVFFVGSGHRYIGYITEEQLSWLEKDLQQVPKGSTVVVSLHIPTNNGEKKRHKAKAEELGGVVSNRAALYQMLTPYKVHFMSGHTHWNENWEKDNMIEHNHGTVCGAWWTGPVCGDGTPNGYGVYEVDGEEIRWFYKSVGFPKEHQLRVYPKGAVTDMPDAVTANVWNWDARWKVEWWEDGVAKGEMQQYAGYDQAAVELYKGPELPVRSKGVEPILTDHLFKALPSTGAKNITVKATDRFGTVYTESISLS